MLQLDNLIAMLTTDKITTIFTIAIKQTDAENLTILCGDTYHENKKHIRGVRDVPNWDDFKYFISMGDMYKAFIDHRKQH